MSSHIYLGWIYTILILTLCCYYFIDPCYSETDTLHQGQLLKDWDSLLSPNKVFVLKFFGFGTSISPYLGIFYNDIDDDEHKYRYLYEFHKMAVWVANRNNPIPNIYGSLKIDVHGKLSILSSGDTVLDLFSPTLVPRNASVKLLDSGNLVLQELYQDGSVKQVLWKSFDYPTDTLLPGMKLGINLKTGHRWSLTFWCSDQLPTHGSFTLTIDPNGTGQLVILRRGNIHWKSEPWQNGQFENTNLQSSGPNVRLYYMSNETEQSFTYLTKSFELFPSLRMHQDGFLQGLVITFNVQCRSTNDPGCAEGDFEKLECRKDYYFASRNDYVYGNEYVYDERYNLSLYDCKKICWRNCSCMAYTYATENKAGCKIYSQMIYDPAKARHHPYTEYGAINYREETTDTLHQGQVFKDWDELISSNRVFILKFFSFGTMVSPYLGVFYNNNNANNNMIKYRYSESSPSTAVWVANRNNPIPDVYGNLKIDVNGKLSILSSEVTVLDLFRPSQVTRNASVRLLDSGNLVVQELYPDGSIKEVLWQSFDYPTDTLLPGMKLGINLKTGHRWSLTSWRNNELPADGSFTLTAGLHGTGQMVILRQKNVHWKSGPWRNGQFKNKDLNPGPDVRLYYVSNETEESFTYITKTYDSFPALTMHQDGHLESTGLNIDVHCRSIDNPPGCAEDELENLKCREGSYFDRDNNNNYVFVDEYVYDESYHLNLYDCKKLCWGNCSCVAYTCVTERGVGCKTYGKRIYNPDKTDRDGVYAAIEHHLENKTVEKKMMNKKKKKLWIWFIVMMIPLVVLLSYYLVYKKLDFRGKAKNIQKLLQLQTRRFCNYVQRIYNHVHANKNMNAEVHYFTFQSISSATNNFSSTNKLGEGGFGEVYKGKLADGQDVAVKRLSRNSGQGVTEFKNEIELIAKLQHTNLVRLVGFCVEKKEKILVYEYMPNNSLDFFLFDQRKKGLLDWNSRFAIIDGIAQGLLYLHRFSRLRIIHRDLKASNILLDDYLKPKISDFGLAKLFGINESEANTSRVVGTRGYMSPEYLMEGTVSTKIDVFGFGVLLLEIISGKMNHGSYDTEHPLNLLGLAWELWNEGRGLELMDQVLEDSCTPKEVMTCIHVGLLCVQDHAIDRPTMSEVISMLTNENMHLPEPKQPAFFIERCEAEAARDDNLGNGSVNGQSISFVVA